MPAIATPSSELRSFSSSDPSRGSFVDMKQVSAVILSGGEGTRLYPLTLSRCKPAISFGAKYRLIDVPISNCIHAGLCHIYVVTQFLSSSLHHHISKTYMEGGKSAGKIDLLTAEQKPTERTWYQGTADAVRQNLDYLIDSPAHYFLILSGDQLYNIDFRHMMQYALETDADLTLAALPVDAQHASRMGILKIDSHSFVTDFQEKPQAAALLEKMRSSAETFERAGLFSCTQKPYLGSMGIYLFKRKALINLLKNDLRADFGKHLIPSAIESGRVAAFLYEGYWEDIGTISSFYQANMGLVASPPLFNLHHEERPIFSLRDDLPPAYISKTQLNQTFISDGSRIEAELISHSLLGPRSTIHTGTRIDNSYLMGNDYYTSAIDDHPSMPQEPAIGKNCTIRRAIIDKNVKLGDGVRLINQDALQHYDGPHVFIRDGIIIVPRGSTLPDGFIL